MYFCTAANSPYFNRLLNLIGCLHKVNFDDIVEIAVFDIGLDQPQLEKLSSIKKVKVYTIEKVHPDILKPFEIRPQKVVPGWYAWKPVAIKQALDMFPYVLWIDAGTIILKPLNNVFHHILKTGYMLLHGGPHPLHRHTTKHVIDLFDLDTPDRKWILNAPAIAAFWIGVTQDMGKKLIDPVYNLASDLKNFIDDGSSSCGAGAGRHDLTLFSIYAHLLNLDIYFTNQLPTQIYLTDKKIPFYATWETSKFMANQALYDIYYQVREPMGFDRSIHYL